MRSLLTLLLFCPVACLAADGRPNIVFVLADDLGWGDLGVYHQNSLTDHPSHRTPHLDRMAEEGLQMRQHYCPAPVCAPSRSSLLSGVHQGNAVIRNNQFDRALEDNHTLASVLQEAGYATALVGKYGLQGTKRFGDTVPSETAEGWPAYPTKRGFDEFLGYVRHKDGHVHYPIDVWPVANAGHREPVELWHNDREISDQLDNCYTSDLFTAYSKKWIGERADAGEPFFLYLAYDTPHAALQVPAAPYPDGFGKDGGVQWTGEPGRMINTADGEPDSFIHPEYASEDWPDLDKRFATMVRRIDDHMADLLQTLRDHGLADNTLVVFSSDNGPHHESYVDGDAWGNGAYTPQAFQSYGPFDGTKRDTWEGGIRVPTLAWGPGVVRKGVNETPSQFHDWLPTFAELAGVAAPARSDGVSLVPTLTGEGEQRTPVTYVEYQNGGSTPKYEDFAKQHRGQKRKEMQAVFLDGHKGVRMNIQSADDPFLIFDLSADPDEVNDLAGTSPRFEALQRRMRDRVLQIRSPNPDAKRPYDDAPVPPLATPEELSRREIDAGIRWTAYAGDFAYVPQVAGLEELTSGRTADEFAGGAADAGAVAFTQSFVVNEDGPVTFRMSSGRPFFARLNGPSDGGHLIDADRPFEAGKTFEATRTLAAGLHEVSVITLTGDDGRAAVRVERE